MASPPDAGRPRHVGSIVDPLVREDGGSDPEVRLQDAPGSPRDEAASDPAPTTKAEANSAVSEPTAREGHPVRDRLLAKAAAFGEGTADLDKGPTPVPAGRSRFEEFEQVAPSSRAPSAPIAVDGRSVLSPTAFAVFGALVGLATVASIIAVLIQLDPRRHDATSGEPAQASATPPAADFSPPPAKKRERKKLPGPWRVTDAKGTPNTKVLSGTIGQNPFLKVVQDAGMKKAQAYRVYTALKGLRNLDKCDRTDKFTALIDTTTSRVKAFEYIVSKEEVYQAKEDKNDGLLKGHKLDLKLSRERYSGAFRLDGESFDAAARHSGFEPGLDDMVGRALEAFTGISMMQRGDRLRVIAQEVTVLGEFSRYAGVEAVEYVPADPADEPLRVYYFRGPRSRGYFDAKGRSLNEGGWRKPIKGAPISSRFNPKRLHPVLKKVMPHNGTDFAAPAGTPIRASSYGTVSFVGYAGASGNLVKIDHPGGIETGYAHCTRFADGLKVGDAVKRLQIIAYVGSTGRSTGPHLHFSAKKDGKFIDPESLNLDSMKVLPVDERAAFAAHRAKYDKLLDGITLPPALQKPTPKAEPVTEAAADDPDIDEGPTVAADAEEPTEPKAPPSTPEAPAGKVPGAAAVYLTDEELMKMQGLEDDGEVDE